MQTGTVYLLKEKWMGLVKIGFTTNLPKRLEIMKTSMPMEYEVIHTIEDRNYKMIERELHKKFAHKKVLREWYKLDKKDIQSIKKGEF